MHRRKRPRDSDSGEGGELGPPPRESSVYECWDQMTFGPGPLIKRVRLQAPRTTMSELLNFILDHEEAFKNRNRLASLYADFRSQASTNPDGYHANISAWKRALSDAARAGYIPSQNHVNSLLTIRTNEALIKALQHPRFGRPTCLPAVFAHGLSNGELIPLKHFLDSSDSIYKRSWSDWVPTPLSIVKWGLRQAGVLGQPGSGELGVDDYVFVSNVEAAGNEILRGMESVTSTVDRIMSRQDFLKRFSNALDDRAPLSTDDLEVLLVHLARDKGALAYNSTTIKFASTSETSPEAITSDDITIANMRDTIAKMNAQISPLTEKIAAADHAAREAVVKKQMVQAKAALRSKKMAETVLQQRMDAVLQLESVYADLEKAADQVEIVEAMKAGSVALKGLNAKVGGADGVAAVVDALRDEMDTADEITNIINDVGQPVDETAIDDEFEALERAEEMKHEAEEKAKREKREQEEAANTAAKLAELEEAEKKIKEKAAAQASLNFATVEGPADEDTEEKIEDTRLSFSQVSVEDSEEQHNVKEKEEPMLAS